jgi:hypothetical protein
VTTLEEVENPQYVEFGEEGKGESGVQSGRNVQAKVSGQEGTESRCLVRGFLYFVKE